MTRKRISIAGLMGLVVVIAVGLVALKQADPTWASAWFTLAILALTVGLFRAAFGHGRSRTFWAGFSLGGWLYLLVTHGVFYRSSPDRVDPPPLLTQYGIVRVQEIIQPESVFFATIATPPPTPLPGVALPAPIAPPTPAPGVPAPPAPAPMAVYLSAAPAPAIRGSFLLASTVARASFEQIGESIWTLLIAWTGGFYALRLASMRDASRARDGVDVSPSSP